MSRAQLSALVATIAILALFAWSGSRGVFLGGQGGVVTDQFEGASIGGVGTLEARISQGAGTLRLATADSEAAYAATLTHDRSVRVRVDYRRGDLRISDDRRLRFPGRLINDWTITLSRRIPVDLRVSTGAGRAMLDLTGLRGEVEVRAGAGEVKVEFAEGNASLDALELQAGAGRFEATGLGHARARKIEARAGVGEYRLDFSGPGRELTEVEINGGVGRIVLTLPDGVGVRIRARGGVTSRLNLTGFTQRGEDEYANATWETAASKIDIRARLGVGEFEVRGR